MLPVACRKVQRDTGTGGESERIKLTLTIQVEGVEYDAEGAMRCVLLYTSCTLCSALHALKSALSAA